MSCTYFTEAELALSPQDRLIIRANLTYAVSVANNKSLILLLCVSVKINIFLDPTVMVVSNYQGDGVLISGEPPEPEHSETEAQSCKLQQVLFSIFSALVFLNYVLGQTFLSYYMARIFKY